MYKWNPAERAELTAELDAAFFHLYGIDRDDAAYILGTFGGAQRADAAELFPVDNLILEKFERLAGGGERHAEA